MNPECPRTEIIGFQSPNTINSIVRSLLFGPLDLQGKGLGFPV